MAAPATVNDPSQAFNQTYGAIQTGSAKVTQVPVFDDNTGAESTQTVLVDAKGNQLPVDAVVPGSNGQYQIQIGSAGGTIHTTVSVDPKTGVVAPITDYNQQVGYTGGSPGSFLASTTNAVNQMVAGLPGATFIPGVAPVVAGLNAANSILSGKPLNIGTVLNAATALSGTNIIPPEAATALKTANQALSVANALKTGNVTGLINSVIQMTGASSDVKAVMNGVNAATALQKGDVAGALNAVNNLTNSVDPKIASLATTVLKQIDPSISGGSKPAAATPASNNTSTTNTTTQGAASTATPTSTSTSPPTNPLQPGATGVNWNQASTIAAGIGLPDLAHVLYHGKYFGAEYEKIDPKTGQVEFTNTPQTTGLPGASGNQATEVASSQTQEQPAAQAQPQQDSIMALIDKIMQSDTPTSASDLQNMILGT
jgi:hypothetical protein